MGRSAGLPPPPIGRGRACVRAGVRARIVRRGPRTSSADVPAARGYRSAHRNSAARDLHRPAFPAGGPTCRVGGSAIVGRRSRGGPRRLRARTAPSGDARAARPVAAVNPGLLASRSQGREGAKTKPRGAARKAGPDNAPAGTMRGPIARAARVTARIMPPRKTLMADHERRGPWRIRAHEPRFFRCRLIREAGRKRADEARRPRR